MSLPFSCVLWCVDSCRKSNSFEDVGFCDSCVWLNSCRKVGCLWGAVVRSVHMGNAFKYVLSRGWSARNPARCIFENAYVFTLGLQRALGERGHLDSNHHLALGYSFLVTLLSCFVCLESGVSFLSFLLCLVFDVSRVSYLAGVFASPTSYVLINCFANCLIFAGQQRMLSVFVSFARREARVC